MTTDRFIHMDKSSLEVFLNTIVSAVTYTSTDRGYVRRHMYEEICKYFPKPDFNVHNGYVDYSKCSISCKGLRFGISVALGATKTGEVIQISRLKSKDKMKAGKVKIDSISSSCTFPWFEIKDGTMQNTAYTSGISVSLTKEKKIFSEMNNSEFLLALAEKQNYPKDNVKSIWEAFRHTAAQPYLKQFYFKKDNKEIINFLKPHFPNIEEELKQDEKIWFERTIEYAGVLHKDLIDESIKKLF